MWGEAEEAGLRQFASIIQQTGAVRRWQIVEQMEHAIALQDEDDLFLVLSV